MKRIIVAITGASGAIYGVRALQLLKGIADVESHVILTSSAQRTIAHARTNLTTSVHSPIASTTRAISVPRCRRVRS